LEYQGKYSQAEKNYRTYLESHPYDYVAGAGLYSCQQITEWKKQPSRYQLKPVKEFNAKRTSNFCPAFIGTDAGAVMFTSNRQERSSNNKKTYKFVLGHNN